MPPVAREIVGFSLDKEGDWVAALSCGHGQHVRHRPPWELRPWILTEEGRLAHLGSLLCCVNCGMPALPSDVERWEVSRDFDETSILDALLHTHALKSGEWARVVVLEGRLLYVIEGEGAASFVLRPEVPGIVAPEVPHHLESRGAVRFQLEFYACGSRP